MFSLNQFTDEEKMLKEMVNKFANERIGPKVLQMDEEQKMDPTIIQGCFENGEKFFFFLVVDEKINKFILLDEIKRIDGIGNRRKVWRKW